MKMYEIVTKKQSKGTEKITNKFLLNKCFEVIIISFLLGNFKLIWKMLTPCISHSVVKTIIHLHKKAKMTVSGLSRSCYTTDDTDDR